jgi:hypothetical protein
MESSHVVDGLIHQTSAAVFVVAKVIIMSEEGMRAAHTLMMQASEGRFEGSSAPTELGYVIMHVLGCGDHSTWDSGK